MRHRTWLTTVGAALALAFLAPTAAAKGASEAEVTWEGLATPVRVGLGRGGPPGIDQLAGDAGLMAVMWAGTPSSLLEAAPTDDLGPAVTISWTVPGPSSVADVIVQTVYPHAVDGPLVFTEPGQPFFGSEQTVGGWLRAPARLTTTMLDLGAPTRPASVTPADDGAPVPWLPIGATLGGIALVLAVARIAAGRRLAPAAATS